MRDHVWHGTVLLMVAALAYSLAALGYFGLMRTGFFMWTDLGAIGAVVGLVGLGMREEIIV